MTTATGDETALAIPMVAVTPAAFDQAITDAQLKASKLKEIVEREDKQRPLSDDALVKELEKQGIKLARRTVTKYRKAMDIPSSRQRREY